MINKKLEGDLKKASYVRKMFEQGEELRRLRGADKIFDFSLGNPEAEPPQSVRESIARHAADGAPGLHRYMSNAGYAFARERVAEHLAEQSGVGVGAGNVVMTVGAAGGLNIVLKAILEPGDEVAVFAPYFKEYDFYAENHGGRVVPVQTSAASAFRPDAEALERAITARTKALIINSPNNPTGAVYDEACLRELDGALERCGQKYGTRILAISDEPYAKIAYDGVRVPQALACFRNAVVVSSYSKSLALAGERIGYVAASPNIEGVGELVDGLVFCNRVLGFVNAPALMQRVVADNAGAGVDMAYYAERRDAICAILDEAGFDFVRPQGAFYVFPKVLGGDEEAFKDRAVAHNILIVPGSGFAGPGHFRLSFCVAADAIRRSRDAFLALAAE
ncbi:MAG: pyridoxal phosphate-dependent aminotransferase, partial [Clostridiales bacterium]|nr:pyridoxal phosphate-dependent aminotransferase [Clostridiales bacterium]